MMVHIGGQKIQIYVVLKRGVLNGVRIQDKILHVADISNFSGWKV
jgi:hypothetical protein